MYISLSLSLSLAIMSFKFESNPLGLFSKLHGHFLEILFPFFQTIEIIQNFECGFKVSNLQNIKDQFQKFVFLPQLDTAVKELFFLHFVNQVTKTILTKLS